MKKSLSYMECPYMERYAHCVVYWKMQTPQKMNFLCQCVLVCGRKGLTKVVFVFTVFCSGPLEVVCRAQMRGKTVLPLVYSLTLKYQ